MGIGGREIALGVDARALMLGGTARLHVPLAAKPFGDRETRGRIPGRAHI